LLAARSVNVSWCLTNRRTAGDQSRSERRNAACQRLPVQQRSNRCCPQESQIVVPVRRGTNNGRDD
jgi:hypothetical protein